MKSLLERKSLAAGCILGVFTTFMIGAVSPKPGHPVGRYEIKAIGSGNDVSVFLVDTHTGQVWKNRSAGAGSTIEIIKPRIK